MAKVVAVGFDPRKEVNSVSHVCSDCGAHLDIYADGEDTLKERLTCPECKAEIVVDEIVWQPPVDIADALSKQSAISADGKKCPVCGKRFGNQKPNFCSGCGQHIKW